MGKRKKELKKIIKKQKKKIDTLEKKYTAISNHSKIGIATIDAEGNFIKVNKKYCEIVDFSETELLSMNFKDITYKDDIKKDLEIHAKTKDKENDSFVMEKRYSKRDGKVVWVDIFVNHIRDENGIVIYSIAMINDITKRKKIQNTILEQTKTMQMYLDLVDVMIVALDRRGIVTLVNRKACEVIGLPEELIIGRNWFKNFLPDDVKDDIFKYFLEVIESGDKLQTTFQNEILSKEGERRSISWRNTEIRNKQKKIIGTLSSGEDITDFLKLEDEKRRHEQTLFNQSKMASMGEMLRNIAHQWRQPLSTISTAASGIKIQKELGTLKEEDFLLSLDTIVDTTKYLSHTINDFQNYFKKDSSLTEFSFQDLIDNIRNLISANYKFNEIEFIPEIKNDKLVTSMFNEIIQVTINILNNAKDAFEKKELESKVVQFLIQVKSKKIEIIIKDNAGGIPVEIINRVFEPYFTTKHKFLGTGIGLYMTKDIIENHLNGKIEVYNEEVIYNNIHRLGAVFKIVIPNIH